MSSIRDQIVAAMVTTLNTSTPVGVPAAERARLREIKLTPAAPRSIVVFPLEDEPQPSPRGHVTRIVRKRLRVGVECRALGVGGVSADAAVDPLYVWVVKALVGKQLSDGGSGVLNHDIEEGPSSIRGEQLAEGPASLCSIEMLVDYQHFATDPERRL